MKTQASDSRLRSAFDQETFQRAPLSRSGTTLYSRQPQQTTSHSRRKKSHLHPHFPDWQSAQPAFPRHRRHGHGRRLRVPALSSSCSYESALRATNESHQMRNVLVVDFLQLEQRILNGRRRSEQQFVGVFQRTSLFFGKTAAPQTHAVHAAQSRGITVRNEKR